MTRTHWENTVCYEHNKSSGHDILVPRPTVLVEIPHSRCICSAAQCPTPFHRIIGPLAPGIARPDQHGTTATTGATCAKVN